MFSALYMLFVGFLMVSSLPTWSFKRMGGRISRGLVLPVMLGLILVVVILFSYPWMVLTCSAVAYLVTIPFSYRDWHRREAAEAAKAAQAADEARLKAEAAKVEETVKPAKKARVAKKSTSARTSKPAKKPKK